MSSDGRLSSQAHLGAPASADLLVVRHGGGIYSIRAVGTMVFAAVSAATVARFFLGDHPSFIVPAYELVSAWELPMYAGLGIVAALAAGVFVRVLYFSEDVFARWRFPPYLKPAVGGLVVGLVGFFLPQVFGTGFAPIGSMLNGQYLPGLLLLLVAAKIFATSVTLGAGSSGGVFAPALFIGAALGGACGSAMYMLFPTVTAGSGAYAIVGMAAVFAAAARAPITAIVMLFELTLDYRIMLPVMLATVVAAAIANWAEPESIYTLKLVRRGIDFAAERAQRALTRLLVSEVMMAAHELTCLHPQAPLSEALAVFQKKEDHACPIVDEEGRLIGIITISDVERTVVESGPQPTVGEACTRSLVCAFQNEPVTRALARAGESGVHRMPVVNAADRTQLVGMLTSADMVRAYNRLFVSQRSKASAR
ncbi:MAG: chloride channel protein [Gaiellales bacterium]|nr:chloride channel protein [Gaiellales bacterium]